MRVNRLAEIAAGQNYLQQAAELVRLSMQEFYNTLPMPHEEKIALIGAQIETPEMECHNPLVAEQGGRIVGLLALFPTEELSGRQQVSVADLVRIVGPGDRKNFLRALTKVQGNIEAILSPKGTYVARVAVSPESRGLGIGRMIMQQVIRDYPAPLSLHVDHTNAGAIAFYKNLGFRFQSDVAYDKKVMIAET